MITLAPHHPLLPDNYFGIEERVNETTSSSSTSNESTVNPFDPLSWHSFMANASKRTIESIDFTNGTALNLDEVTSQGGTKDESNSEESISKQGSEDCTNVSTSNISKFHPQANPQLNAQKHNRLLNTVTGKRKKGGQKLKERSIICQVKCTDGSVFSILAGIKGTLVEINEALLTQPNLLIDEVS